MGQNQSTGALTVGEVAARSGVPVSTVHFYEAQGLIAGWRTAGNQRRYGRPVLRRIAIIQVAQRAGLSLKAVAGFLTAFSGLNFTVYLLTDQTYREEFRTEVVGELRQAFAVRAAYRRYGGGLAEESSTISPT